MQHYDFLASACLVTVEQALGTVIIQEQKKAWFSMFGVIGQAAKQVGPSEPPEWFKLERMVVVDVCLMAIHPVCPVCQPNKMPGGYQNDLLSSSDGPHQETDSESCCSVRSHSLVPLCRQVSPVHGFTGCLVS